ncbi:MAG: AEC family transporter [Eubacterium sp.]|nr:AEC family transporter [Eubacterium sp.]
MAAVILKALSMVLVIAVAYTFKRCGVLGEGSKDAVSKLVMYLTLPAAIITSFDSYERDDSLLILAILGFGFNLFFYLVGCLVSCRGKREDKVFSTLNYPGYNIGSFTLPFVQNFLGALGVVTTCMFDMGNSVMCTGGSFALTAALFGAEDEKVTLKDFFKKLFSSVPFDVYLGLLVMSQVGLKFPKTLLTLMAPAAAANGFMAMVMLGLMFEIKFKKAYFWTAIKTLGSRYLLMAVLALLCWHFLPLALEQRQVLVVVLFSPMSALSPVFTDKCGGDSGLSGFLSSLSIILSVIIMTALIGILGIL